MFAKKRGQITAFIILGLLILLGLVLYLYSQQMLGLEGPLNVETVRGRIELCLAQSAEKAFIKLGERNGYLFDSDFANSISTGNYTLSEEMMHDQINKYLVDNLQGCINNFDDLKDYFNIILPAELASEIIYRDDETIVKLHYPVEISDNLDQQTKIIEDFEVSIPVRLKLILGLKQKMELDEEVSRFMSKFFIGNLDLPVKQKQQSLDEYQKLLVDYIASSSKQLLTKVKVANTDFDKKEGDFEWVISDEVYPQTSVAFGYNRLPLKFNKPGFGLRPEFNQNLMKYSEYLQKEAFDLDFFINVPVTVTIKDALSFDKQGYEFNFVLPVGVDFSADHEQFDHVICGLDISSVSADPALKVFGPAKKIGSEHIIVEIYNDFAYAAAIYPYDRTISIPVTGADYFTNVLMFRDYKLVGGYKNTFSLDRTKTKLKLTVLEFSGLTDSLITKKLESTDYLDDVGFGFE